MKKFDIELAVGFFLIIGIISLAYISVKLGKLEVLGGNYYTVYAEFEKAGGVKPGAAVEIAGVEVGKVKSLRLDKNYQAYVEMVINTNVKIQEDAIASIKTKGLIGEKYIQITPGGSDKIISSGGKIRETESVVDIEELISKYVFGKV
ncbi:MAG: outer membrane lipid asymmetry maintenance protein MlaD [Nitrospirota bacterium]|nr:outer membrane lipid asymmetry maintenance protein MlaD [Nitrospirota bacterium]MDH5767644.1 outer membrane lipid asymmetry maintenance protein MlaD [Nitrospirota bacterium]